MISEAQEGGPFPRLNRIRKGKKKKEEGTPKVFK